MFLFCLLPRRFLGKLSTEDEFLTARKVFPAKKNILTQKNIRPHQRSCCFRIWQTFCQDCRQGASMDWPMTPPWPVRHLASSLASPKQTTSVEFVIFIWIYSGLRELLTRWTLDEAISLDLWWQDFVAQLVKTQHGLSLHVFNCRFWTHFVQKRIITVLELWSTP